MSRVSDRVERAADGCHAHFLPERLSGAGEIVASRAMHHRGAVVSPLAASVALSYTVVVNVVTVVLFLMLRLASWVLATTAGQAASAASRPARILLATARWVLAILTMATISCLAAFAPIVVWGVTAASAGAADKPVPLGWVYLSLAAVGAVFIG